MKKNLFLTVLILLALFCCLCSVAFAQSYTLYSSVGETDTNTRNLIGLYQNSPYYDPYNQFFVCRTGQYEYHIFFGKNLSYEYRYYRYYGTNQGGYQQTYYFDSGSGNNLQIAHNGYVGVGNVENSLQSDKAETFKFQYVIIILTLLITSVFLFKVFKMRFNGSDRRKGWRV